MSGHHHGTHHGTHGGPHGGHRDAHGNPADLDDYLAKMEDASRAEWQKPDEVVRALGLAPGQVACDVGAGPGYFALRLARAVGPAGHVYAVDVELRMLGVLRERIAAAGARNVTPVLGLGDDPLLPDRVCDLALIVDTFHHFPDGLAWLRRIARTLRPGGRLVNIDFHARELPVGPPLGHKIAREDFLSMAETAGFTLVEEPSLLPYQYFLILALRSGG